MSKIIRPGGVVLALFFVLAIASFGQSAPAQESAEVVSGTATSDTSYPVITRGNGKEVNILLKSASGRAAPVATGESGGDVQLENTTWNLRRLGDKEEKASGGERVPYIFLDPSGDRLSGSGGCNRLSGTYQVDKQTIRFGPTALTMMACPKGMDREKDFMEALGRTRSWKIRGEKLELYDEEGKSLARFDAGETK